jgi:hypothetical protein
MTALTPWVLFANLVEMNLRQVLANAPTPHDWVIDSCRLAPVLLLKSLKRLSAWEVVEDASRNDTPESSVRNWKLIEGQVSNIEWICFPNASVILEDLRKFLATLKHLRTLLWNTSTFNGSPTPTGELVDTIQEGVGEHLLELKMNVGRGDSFWLSKPPKKLQEFSNLERLSTTPFVYSFNLDPGRPTILAGPAPYEELGSLLKVLPPNIQSLTLYTFHAIPTQCWFECMGGTPQEWRTRFPRLQEIVVPWPHIKHHGTLGAFPMSACVVSSV